MSLRITILGALAASLLAGVAWRWPSRHAASGGAASNDLARSAPSEQGAEASATDDPRAISGVVPVSLAQLRVTTPTEVREVLRSTRQATAQDRPALVEAALRAEDPLVAGNAARALGRLRSFSSDPDLLDLTSDPRLRVRQDAVIACGLDGGDAAIPCLEQVLVSGDASLRPLALDALGKIGGPIALERLRQVAADPAATEVERVFARSALSSQSGGR
jgi:HEAT repeat protein